MSALNLDTIYPELAVEILKWLSPSVLQDLYAVSWRVQTQLSYLDSEVDYWRDCILSSMTEMTVAAQDFWYNILSTSLPATTWKQLVCRPHYAVGKLLSDSVVTDYGVFGFSTNVLMQVVRGIIDSDRLSLFQSWTEKHLQSSKTTVEDYVLVSQSQSIFRYVVGNRMRSERGLNWVEYFLLRAVESVTTDHYSYIAELTRVKTMFPKVMKYIIIHRPEMISWYLDYAKGSQKVFKDELAILKRCYWTYHNESFGRVGRHVQLPRLSYLKFLDSIIEDSTDDQITAMIQQSPLKHTLGSYAVFFDTLMTRFCQHPRITSKFVNEVLMPKTSSNLSLRIGLKLIIEDVFT
jgi:hypothetical protein